MKVEIEILEERIEGVVAILNGLLSDEYVLGTRTRNYHWKVIGPQFNELHKFFEAQYEALNEIVDEVAERTRTVGEWPFGSLSEFLKRTRLKEQPGEGFDAPRMIANLLADHESMLHALRTDLVIAADDYEDAGTSNFLTDLHERHENLAWMLKSFGEKD